MSLSKRIVLLLIGLGAVSASAQSDIPHLGIGVSASTLGAGIQVSTGVTKHSNVRAGFNMFQYSHGLDKDGVHYAGELKLRSAQATYDYFFGPFHISPGALIYDDNKATATASVGAGQVFTLGGTTYYSSPANPVLGTGSLTLKKAAPMILVGFGNPLPRGSKRFGWNLEAGVVFEGTPKAALNLGGTACLTSAQLGCLNAATDPTVQANVVSEQNKLNKEIGPFKYYPVVSLGFSFKIK